MKSEDLKNEFFFPQSERGCLLIHGFSSTPAEVRELGEKIGEQGYTVLAIKLAGHGSDIQDMEKVKYTDWIKSAEDGYKKLKKICSQIYLIGHSMGALLALYIAENYPVDKVVVLAPAVITKDRRAKFVSIAKYLIKYIEWKPRKRPEEEAKYMLGYNKVPLASVHELNKLQKVSIKGLRKLNKPILAIQSYKDQTVDIEGVKVIQDNISSDIKVVYLNNCGHNITIEGEKEKVFKEVVEFLSY